MYEKLEVCPICRHSNFENYLICKDHSISGESFALNKCKKCELVFTNPRPKEAVLSKYYEDSNYISHANKSTNLINFLYKLVRSYTLSKKVQLIKTNSIGKTLLDYGCGTGEFLQKCTKKGYSTFGVEPNQVARIQAESKGLKVVQDLNLLNEKFDIITAWHVLEHVSDLKKTTKELRKLLNENGLLIVAVPNLESYDSAYYKEHWAALDVPRHLYHFTQSTFGKLIEETNLHLLKTLPMQFDSYYVSMLSEKYLTGKTHIFKALRIGHTSNKKAKQSGEYSSLIYILKK